MGSGVQCRPTKNCKATVLRNFVDVSRNKHFNISFRLNVQVNLQALYDLLHVAVLPPTQKKRDLHTTLNHIHVHVGTCLN